MVPKSEAKKQQTFSVVTAGGHQDLIAVGGVLAPATAAGTKSAVSPQRKGAAKNELKHFREMSKGKRFIPFREMAEAKKSSTPQITHNKQNTEKKSTRTLKNIRKSWSAQKNALKKHNQKFFLDQKEN